MAEIIYGIYPVTVSKGFGKVYNKQMIIGKYLYDESSFNIELLEMIPITGTQKQADSKKNSFDIRHRKIEILQDIGDNEIFPGQTTARDMQFYKTQEMAKISKYVYMDNIKSYFDIKLSEIKQIMENNLPKGLAEEMKIIEDKYPEYFI